MSGSDPVGSGNFLAKLYFVLVHVFLFLLGFFVIQKKAKELEHEKEQKEKKDSENKSLQKEKSVLNCVNMYLKTCYQFSGSYVHMFVDKWLSSVERGVEKELKSIGMKEGGQNQKIVSSIEIERNDEIPCKVESMKQQWQKGNEMVIELVVKTKPLKFKVLNSKKEISFFVLPAMNLKGLVYVDYGKETEIRYIEVKALREIKLSLSVEGKHKEMCNYIAEALNKVFVKAKKIAILQPIKAEDSQQNVTNPKDKTNNGNEAQSNKKNSQASINETNLSAKSKSRSDVKKSSDKLFKNVEGFGGTKSISNSQNVIGDWSNDKKFPPKQIARSASSSTSRLNHSRSENKQQMEQQRHEQQQQKMKMRAKSVPYALPSSVSAAKSLPFDLNSSESTTSTMNRRSPADSSSDTSSIFFEPISPLPPSELSKSFDGGLYPGNNSGFPFSSNETLSDEVADESTSFSFKPVNSFQAMQGSLTQTFDERNNNTPGFNHGVPRAKASQRGSRSASKNTPSTAITSTPKPPEKSPKIHNAIEPQFTVAELPQKIKTPIMKVRDDSALKQQRSQLTKSNVLRHSFHHDSRPKLGNAQSLGALNRNSDRSDSPNTVRGTVSQVSLNSAIGCVSNKSSALVIETTSERFGNKYYHIPPAMVKKGNLPHKGQKLHIYNEHIFTATHFTGHMPLCCVCHLPLKRMGKQGYSCRDCKIIVHKRCHCKIVETCPMSSLPNMEIEYVGGTDV